MMRPLLRALVLLGSCSLCAADALVVDEYCAADVNVSAGMDLKSDVALSNTTTPWVLRPLWPVTPSKLPCYLSIVLCVWLFVGSQLRVTRTEQDEIFEERRARQVLDQVAQAVYEHWKVEVELHEHEVRDLQLQELARQRIRDEEPPQRRSRQQPRTRKSLSKLVLWRRTVLIIQCLCG